MVAEAASNLIFKIYLYPVLFQKAFETAYLPYRCWDRGLWHQIHCMIMDVFLNLAEPQFPPSVKWGQQKTYRTVLFGELNNLQHKH